MYIICVIIIKSYIMAVIILLSIFQIVTMQMCNLSSWIFSRTTFCTFNMNNNRLHFMHHNMSNISAGLWKTLWVIVMLSNLFAAGFDKRRVVFVFPWNQSMMMITLTKNLFRCCVVYMWIVTSWRRVLLYLFRSQINLLY